MKVLVKSIRFTTEGKNLLNEKDGSPAIVVELNTEKNVTIDLDGANVRINVSDGFGRDGKITDTEADVCWLVYKACYNYLNGDPEESMDYEQCEAAARLADRIDWDAAGYPEEGEPGERYISLSEHISHYQDI